MEQPIMELVSEDAIRYHVQGLAARIDADYPDGTLYLLGVLKGSCVFLADLAQAIKRPVRIDFIGVKRTRRGEEVANPGQAAVITSYPRSVLGDSHVLVVDGIVGTGVTVKQVYAYLITLHLHSVQVVTLLDKPSRRTVRGLHLKYIGCQVPDVFVVGYGMDYEQDYRDLPGIHILRKCMYKHCVFYTSDAETFCSAACLHSDSSVREMEIEITKE